MRNRDKLILEVTWFRRVELTNA